MAIRGPRVRTSAERQRLKAIEWLGEGLTIAKIAAIVGRPIGDDPAMGSQEPQVTGDPLPLMAHFKLPILEPLDEGERRVLAEIESGGRRAKSADISRALGIIPPSLECRLTRLPGAGIIEVRPFEENRRHRLVQLTSSGRLILLADRHSSGRGESGIE